MVLLTKNALSGDLINEAEQTRYSLLFAKLDGTSPFNGYMCRLHGGARIKQARPKSVTRFLSR